MVRLRNVVALACGALAGCGGGGGGASPLPSTPVSSSPAPSPSRGATPTPIVTPTPTPVATPTPTPVATPTPTPVMTPTPMPPAGAIKHIVIIVQENRSFDNLFNGFPGADTVQSGTTSQGTTIALQPVGLESSGDISHSHQNFEREYANGNLYFNLGDPSQPAFPYSYVPPSETQPYWALASRYTLADRMFQSNNGPSFPAHLFLIAGQSGSGSQLVDENPNQQNTGLSPLIAWGCDDPPGTYAPVLGSDGLDHNTGLFPCFDYPTLADAMDAAHVTWRYYAPAVGSSGAIWSVYDAIRHIRYGSDWTQNVVSPETNVLADASSALPSVTWVTPSAANSDHSGIGSSSGPSWVASVVNAIGSGPNWNSTAIFIVWDDWGGWYDHVVPAQLDQMGLGFRVPLIVVSPYARHGYVSHVQHEFGSILRFTEEAFGLPTLTTVDGRADDLRDCFDFTQPPRAFSAIPGALPALYFTSRPRDRRLPDDD